jgi:hypothetical protein
MHDPTLREEMENFHIYLREVLQADRITIPSKDYDLVLNITVTEEQKISWSYYYACHESRCLFWLKAYDATYMVSELFGVSSPAHVSALQFLHWNLLLFYSCCAQNIDLSPFIGELAISCLIGVLTADVAWIGLTGHFFR